MIDPLTILQGDAVEMLKTLPDESVQCCVTSPPYWGLRSYLPKGHPLKPFEIGQEKTPADYVAKMVEVFSQVRRVLKSDGTCWLNLGDSYASNWPCNRRSKIGEGSLENGKRENRPPRMGDGLKNKDLVGIPWMVAFALRADGWYLRSDIIWAKPNCMPESVTDRPTRSHEYIFLLTKSEKYYYDAEAIKEPCSESFLNDPRHKTGSSGNHVKIGHLQAKAQDSKGPHRMFDKQRGHSRRHQGFNERWDAMEKKEQCSGTRNKRDVWWVSPAMYPEAHFATFSPELILPCILAGSRTGDVVLDPFLGSGTTAKVALEEGRKAIGIELNSDYIPFIQQRTNVTVGLLL